jgi:NAD(P)-dependent dehydrogenase (short-subunit alcohol dehydrogenase family)
MSLLGDRTAVVTGGAGGIGGGVSRRLAAEGATVVVNDIDEGLLDALVKELGAAVIPVPGDIRDKATVERVAAAGADADILVNNVGDFRPSGRFLKGDEAQWEALYAVNLEHVFRMTHALLPGMVERGRGSIVNVSTVEAIRGYPGGPVYSAFNAGVIAFTRSLAVEVGRDGVRVNCIAPDLADTLATPVEMMLRGRDPEMIKHWSPVGRWGEPEAYGDVVVFLASDMSRYVTGHCVPVDGGTLAASGWYLKMDGKGWTNLPDAP